MSRGVPAYSSGTIPAGGGTQAAFIAAIVDRLTAYQSNGEQAWELAQQIDTGVDYEAVFHSVGDRSLGSGSNKGDTDIWVRLHRTGTDDYECRMYQDWSPTSSAGYRESGTGYFAQNIDDNQALDWWSFVNEYEFAFLWLQGGAYGVLAFGALIRPYSAALNGAARITSQSGTGDGVVFGVDRDITASIKVGQYVWLVNQTPDATALQSVGIDLVEVVAKSFNSITVDGVTNTYAVGSLLGIDPMPVYSKLYSGSHYMCQNMDGSYTSAVGQYGVLVNPGVAAITEADWDPGPDQLYLGFQPFVKMSTSLLGFRGKMGLVRIFTLGLQADQDLMEVDFDSGQRWKVFVSTGANFFAGWVTAFGPGAS